MFKRVILFIIFAFFFLGVYSQGARNKNLDSLYRRIPLETDSIKCKFLNTIARDLATNYPDSSFVLAQRSLAIGEKIKFEKGIAYSNFLLGLIKQNRGDKDEAIAYYDKSLTIYKRLNRKDDMSNIYNSLGNIYLQIGYIQDAIANYQTSFDLADKEPKSKYYLAISSIGLASAKGELKQYEEAVKLQEIALKYFKEIGMDVYVPMVLQNMSSNCVDMKQYDKAKKYNDEAIVLFEAGQDFSGLSLAYSSKAEILKREGKMAEALVYAKKAYDLAVKVNVLPEMASKAKLMYMLNKELNDHKSSLEYLELYMSYNDTLNNEEKQKAFADAEAQFYNKEKEQELKLKNLELEKSELAIAQRNKLIYIFIAAFVVFIILLFLVYKQFREKKKANFLLENKNGEIEKQKSVIEEKNKDITDSINYSKHIQQAIIPSQEMIRSHFTDAFVLFKPKDIVSGDFYLVDEVVGLTYLAVVDCTGHGVPGAMLSVFANSTIKNTIASNSFRENPAAILSDLCFQFKSNLQSGQTTTSINDGVDMGICMLDKKQNKLYFSGAKNNLIMIRKGELTQFDGSRWGISGSNKGEHLFFKDHIIDTEKGDRFYLFTDGFADQFGGPKGKKFKQKQLFELLSQTSNMPCLEQRVILENSLRNWKGELEQIDDITVIGFEI